MIIENNNQQIIAIFSFTDDGSKLNKKLHEQLEDRGFLCESYAVERFADKYQLLPVPADLKQWIGDRWGKKNFLFIGATGIAVRYIAPWVVDKFTDSAVLSVDEDGQYVIPVLSGHLGGAVELAKQVASCIGAVPVISTATDRKSKFAVDVFAKTNELYFDDRQAAKSISAAILEGKRIGFFSECSVVGQLPEELESISSLDMWNKQEYGVAIVNKKHEQDKAMPNIMDTRPVHLFLYPKNLVLGIGCRRGTTRASLEEQIIELLNRQGLSIHQVQQFASIDVKKDEAGILELAEAYGIPFQTFSAEKLNQVEHVSSSSTFVKETVGVDNVCERAAKFACPDGELIQSKVSMAGVTAAIVRTHISIDVTK